MKHAIVLGLTSLCAFASGQLIDKNENPGSLWSDKVPNPIADRTARRVGDVLTVIITERSLSSFSAETTASKKDSNAINQNLWIDWLSRIVKPWTTSDSSSNNGSGETRQQASMSARLTAVVTQVMPNGNLVLEGVRLVAVNKEVQKFKLTGVVWRDYIRPDNTVLSENIANAEIRMEGKGLISDRQRAGLLTRVLDWLF